MIFRVIVEREARAPLTRVEVATAVTLPLGARTFGRRECDKCPFGACVLLGEGTLTRCPGPGPGAEQRLELVDGDRPGALRGQLPGACAEQGAVRVGGHGRPRAGKRR